MSFKRSQRDERNDDYPPMSRLFVICSKSNSEADLRQSFDKFGEIEEVFVVKDRNTGENKGVAYIQFNKTSSAAQALEEMNGKCLDSNSTRPIKVLVASSRDQGSGRQDNEQEKYLRLFVIISKDTNEDDLTDIFKQYGDLDNVVIIRDKITKENKGFAYIKYHKFTHAAIAFENCNSKFKAVFAEPKSSHRNSDRGGDRYDRLDRDRYDRSDMRFNSRYDDMYMGTSSGMGRGGNSGGGNDFMSFGNSNRSGGMSGDAQLTIICSKMVNQDQLWRLFDIIPGLDYCQITGECGRNSNYATVMYASTDAAVYAREKLHGLEYPAGERLIIKPLGDFKNSGNGFIDAAMASDFGCNLPAVCSLADSSSACVQRLFIVCVPKALPINVLINIFSRFENLIDVYLLSNKNCGYAKYANEKSAATAIQTLHGIEICGVKLKVMEAEELRDAKRKRYDEDGQDN